MPFHFLSSIRILEGRLGVGTVSYDTNNILSCKEINKVPRISMKKFLFQLGPYCCLAALDGVCCEKKLDQFSKKEVLNEYF